MNIQTDIPFGWQSQSRQLRPPPYWVTYFGDIYSGSYQVLFGVDDRFFIISHNELKNFKNLQERTIENYNKLGFEIQDCDIIYKHIPEVDTLGDINMPKSFSLPYDKKCKRMFIFGAGASAFCTYDEEYALLRNSISCPPIGYEIFDRRFDSIISNYSGVLATIPTFMAKGKDIEACLEDDWSSIRNFYNPLITAKHTNIQFYIQELFSKISDDVTKKYVRYNLYARLIGDILKNYSGKKGEKIAFVSFNYDFILDTLLERAQGNYMKMDDYIDCSLKPILLFKPHGSSNWGWPFIQTRIGNLNGKTISDALYDNKNKCVPSYIYYYLLGDYRTMMWEKEWGIQKELNPNSLGRFTINKNRIELIDKRSGKNYLPALQLPYRDKDEFIMPFNHFEALKHSFRNVEELYLIGWKGNEDGFNRLMKSYSNNLRKIIIVNPKSDEVRKNLSIHFDLEKFKVDVIENFRDFVLNKIDNYLSE